MNFEKIKNLFGEEKETEKADMSRRDFLKKTAKAAAVAAVAVGISGTVEAGINIIANDKKIKTPEKSESRGIDIKNQIIAKSEKADLRLEAIPDYEKNLEKLLLTIPSKESAEYIREAFFGILASLPDYTEIEIVLDRGNLESVKKLVNEAGVKNKINFIMSDEKENGLEEWAQDYGKAVKINGEKKFLISAKIKKDNKCVEEKEKKRMEKRIDNIKKALGEERVRQSDIYFEGGNLVLDKTEGGLRAFVGFNDFKINSLNFDSKEMDGKAAAKLIYQSLGGAEVVVMGDYWQKGPFVHIDQSFIILDGKKAIVNQFTRDADPAVRRQHQYYRAQLESLGYKIMVIENDRDDLAECRSSLNAIPYVDKNTGEKKIIFPVFDNEIKKRAGDAALNEDSLRGKALIAFFVFKQAGYTPIPVRDSITHIKNGNIHCLSNVLARKLEIKKEMTA